MVCVKLSHIEEVIKYWLYIGLLNLKELLAFYAAALTSSSFMRDCSSKQVDVA